MRAGVCAAEGWGNPAAAAPHLAPRLPAAVSARRWLHGQLTPPRAPGAASALAALHPHSPALGLADAGGLPPGDGLIAAARQPGEVAAPRACSPAGGRQDPCMPGGAVSAPMLGDVAALARRLGTARARLQALAGLESLSRPDSTPGSQGALTQAGSAFCAAPMRQAGPCGHEGAPLPADTPAESSPTALGVACTPGPRARSAPLCSPAGSSKPYAWQPAASAGAAQPAPAGSEGSAAKSAGACRFLRRPLPELEVAELRSQPGSWGAGSLGGPRGSRGAVRDSIQAFYSRTAVQAEAAAAQLATCGQSQRMDADRPPEAGGGLVRPAGRARCVDASAPRHCDVQYAESEEASSATVCGERGRREDGRRRRRRRPLLRSVAG
jgi:hypothetical protein